MTPEEGSPPENAKPSPLSSPRVKAGLLIGALMILVAGLLWYSNYQTRGKYFQSTNDAYVQSDAVVVSSKVSGYVSRIFVGDNQAVRAGQPLVQIDPAEYQAQAQQAQAQIDVARANADAVRAQIREQQAGVAQAQAQLAQAQSGLQFASSEVGRYAPLAATGADPREHLSQLQSQQRQAQAQVNQARAAVAAAQRRTGTLQAQVDQALSQGRAAQAQLAAANVNVRSTIVKASIDGRIGDKTVQTGQLVQPGTRMMSVVPMTQLYIDANFKETQVGLMRVGQPATIKVDALGGLTLKGHVQSFAPGTGAQFSILPPQNATGNFTKIVQRIPVRVAIDAAPDLRKLLVPGMSVDVTVDTRSAKGELDRLRKAQDARR